MRGNWKIGCFTGCLVVVALVVATVVWISISVYRQEHRYDDLSVPRLSRVMGVSLPSSARIVQHTSELCNCSSHYYIFAGVEIDRREVATFVNSMKVQAERARSACQISRTDKLENMYQEADPHWWRVDKVKKFIAVFKEGSYWMLIDLDGKENAVMYIHAWPRAKQEATSQLLPGLERSRWPQAALRSKLRKAEVPKLIS